MFVQITPAIHFKGPNEIKDTNTAVFASLSAGLYFNLELITFGCVATTFDLNNVTLYPVGINI